MQVLLDRECTLTGPANARCDIVVVVGPQHCVHGTKPWIGVTTRHNSHAYGCDNARTSGHAPIMASPANLKMSPPSDAIIRTICPKYALSCARYNTQARDTCTSVRGRATQCQAPSQLGACVTRQVPGAGATHMLGEILCTLRPVLRHRLTERSEAGNIGEDAHSEVPAARAYLVDVIRLARMAPRPAVATVVVYKWHRKGSRRWRAERAARPRSTARATLNVGAVCQQYAPLPPWWVCCCVVRGQVLHDQRRQVAGERVHILHGARLLEPPSTGGTSSPAAVGQRARAPAARDTNKCNATGGRPRAREVAQQVDRRWWAPNQGAGTRQAGGDGARAASLLRARGTVCTSG